MKKLILYGLVFLVLVSFASAVCTVTYDKNLYYEGETVTASAICNSGTEINQLYYLNWTNGTKTAGTSASVQFNNGTTPASINTLFTAQYNIPLDYTENYNDELNATLYGTNLEGSEVATVLDASAAGVNTSLFIQNINITSDYFLGKYGAISFYVRTNSSQNISNAACLVDVVDANNLPIYASATVVPSQGNGKVLFSVPLDEEIFSENKNYKWEISCACYGGNVKNTIGQCYIEDGSSLNFKRGTAQYGFSITDIADHLNWTRRKNTTAPGVWVENQYGVRVNMTANPALKYQEEINWSKYDNEINGDAFLTAGEKFRVCSELNNTFDEEIHFSMSHLSFVAQPGIEILPRYLNGDRMIHQDSEELMHLELKSYSESNLEYVKCSDWFRVPFEIKGQSRFKIKFLLNVEGYGQSIDVDSERFTIFGEKRNETWVPIVEVTNIDAPASVTACNSYIINFTYNYWAISDENKLWYQACIEDVTNDYYLHCTNFPVNPDLGSGNTAQVYLTLPYVPSITAAEIDMWMYKDEARTKQIDFFSSDLSNSEFNISVNNSDSCRYSQYGLSGQDDEMYLNWLRSQSLNEISDNQSTIASEMVNQSGSLADIANKTGTFYFDISIPATVEQTSSLLITVATQRELGTGTVEGHFICYIDGYRTETEDRWTHAVNETDVYTTTRTMYIPASIPFGIQTLVCRAGTASFTNLMHTSSKIVEVVPKTASASGSSVQGKGLINEIIETVKREAIEIVELPFQMPVTVMVLAALFGLVHLAEKQKEDEKQILIAEEEDDKDES